MKNMKNSAYSLIIVLFLTSLLSLLVIGSWYKTSMFTDLVLERERYYKNFYLNNTALNYGIFYLKNHFEYFSSDKALSKMPLKLNVAPLIDFIYSKRKLENFNNNLFTEVIIDKTDKKNALFINSLLKEKKDNKVLSNLSCILKREVQSNESFKIAENKKEKKSKKEWFVVKSFSISNLI